MTRDMDHKQQGVWGSNPTLLSSSERSSSGCGVGTYGAHGARGRVVQLQKLPRLC